MKRYLFLASLVAGFMACSGAPDLPLPEEDPPLEDLFLDTDVSPEGDGTLNPVLEGRAPKRLTVDQLRQTVPQLTDGHTWHQALPYPTDPNAKFLIPMLDLLGSTMGEADYLTNSVNFLDPIPSFMKYVDEMAAEVCLGPLAEDGNDTIVRYPDDVDRNLRYLRLKFHGIYVPEESTEGIGALRTLYDGLFERYSDHPNAAYHVVPWLGVCVAVMTDPEFYIY